jgi:ABC-type lipoprotein release transport system permease subunit
VGRRLQQSLIRHLPSSIHFGYGLRNILRHKGLTASTVICIALAIGVAISYVASMSSVRFTVEQYFQRDQWDLAVDLISPVDGEHVRRVRDIRGVATVVPTVKGGVQLFKGDRRLDGRLFGQPHDSPVSSLNLIAGRTLSTDGAREIVLDKEDAKALDAQIGDSIRVVSGRQNVETELVGLVTGLMSGQAYGGLEMARRVLEMKDRANGLFLSLNPGAGEKETVEKLHSLDFVGRVTSKAAVVDDFMALTSEIMGIVYLCSAFAIVTGVLFIFTSITLNILERETEYATLQTLGFGRRNLAGMVLSEVMVQALVALILSVPAGFLISLFLTGRMSDAWFAIDSHFTAAQFIWILVPAFLVMPVAAVPGLRGIFRINIAEAVRRRVMD